MRAKTRDWERGRELGCDAMTSRNYYCCCYDYSYCYTLTLTLTLAERKRDEMDGRLVRLFTLVWFASQVTG
jgi:hypothetical protein